jgi:F-type H+-transporting ATPase subunit gamma
MPSTREVRRRIRSAKNVAQITRAMEMVAASKMRKAQRNVLAARPYAERLWDVMGELTARMTGGTRKDTLLDVRKEIKTVGLIIITPDRGLCGSLVSNILRRSSRFNNEQRSQGRAVQFYAVGKKGYDFLQRNQFEVTYRLTRLGDTPKLVDTLSVANHVIMDFLEHKQDEAYVIYSKFVNTLVQQTTLKQLLPIEPPAESKQERNDYTYEPDQEQVLEELLPRFVESQIYQAILESIASEHSARMVAMRNATDSAKDLVQDLTQTYNKVRQSAITNEVSEIASGALSLMEG